MSECAKDTPRCSESCQPDAMSIHTRKITDSCRDKDCIEDLRVYLTKTSQATLETATGAKVRCADLLYTYMDVEPVAFDRNHYCVEVTFYYRILADALVGNARPAALYGLGVFTKRAVLCGEESCAHIFTSRTRIDQLDGASLRTANLPTAVVEVLEPMVLSSQVKCDCQGKDGCVGQIPAAILAAFDEELAVTGQNQCLYVTLGQFSIIRLERDAQLTVPVLEYSMPRKTCCEGPCGGEDPCQMFSRIPFPTERFSPKNCDKQNNC